MPVNGGSLAFAVYLVPPDFNLPSGHETDHDRPLQITATFTPAGGAPAAPVALALTLYRPPIVLLHGLWSNSSVWTMPLIDLPYLDIPTPLADYRDTNADRFSVNLLPDPATAAWEEEAATLPVVSVEPLSFAAEADGERALVEGWSESEAWGTWGIGRESRIRFALADANGGGRRLALNYRVIAAQNADPLLVQCASNGAVLDRWRLGPENHRGQLTIELPAAAARLEAPVELTFTTENPRSPAELGLGPDTRQLGIGVEELRVVA